MFLHNFKLAYKQAFLQYSYNVVLTFPIFYLFQKFKFLRAVIQSLKFNIMGYSPSCGHFDSFNGNKEI